MQKPQSRNEAILQSMIADTEYTDPPQSRIEALLLKLKEVIEAGGGEIVVDDEISTTSTHPVQNRVIAANLLPAIAGITPNSSGSMELDREDLNDFTTSGIYNAMNCENAPFNDMALVILGYSMDGYCVQIACDVASGNFKFRNQIDGNWTAWGDNILSTLEAHTAAINELENNTKSIQTVTGNPLTIESSESNLVECKAEVEAVQDLHGYDHPWVGGAGKNKLPVTSSDETMAGIAYTKMLDNDGNVIGVKCVGTISGTSAKYLSTDVTLPAGTYILTGGNGVTSTGIRIVANYTEGGTLKYREATSEEGVTFTLSTETQVAFYLRGEQVNLAVDTIIYPMIRLATETDSSFAPYTNICPISGRDECNVSDVGANLIDITSMTPTYDLNGITYTINSDGSVTANGTATARSQVYWGIPQNTAKTLANKKLSGGSSQSGCSLFLELNESPFTNYATDTGEGATISSDIANATTTVNCIFRIAQGTTVNNLTITPRITDKMKTYTIQLGDTVYGGTLDVTRGKMVVDRGYVDLGDLNWTYTSSYGGLYVSEISDGKYTNSRLGLDAKCSIFEVVKTDFTTLTAGQISVGNYSQGAGHCSVSVKTNNGQYADATAFKTAVTGQTLVYELAEPYTIQLTPQQIRLLKGTNNISCNTGDLSIKYYPDNVLGQLKGDIEDEYDERVENLEEKANNALKIKSITTNTGTNQQGVSSSSYDNYVQGDKKLIPLSITAKTPGYEVVDVHYVLDEINRLIYFIPKDLTGSAIPSDRTVSMTIYYFEI